MFEEVARPRSRWRVFWPDVGDMDGAREAIKLGYWACFIVAALTAVMATFGLMGAGFADAVVVALLGVGLLWKWRTAAVLGFALFTANIGMSLSRGQGVGALAIFLLFCFASAVRGTFAYRRLIRLRAVSGTDEAAPSGTRPS
jgi:hypothetical protein